LISVRGTVFDVDVEDLEGTTFVSLDEGQVVVRHLRVASPLVTLKPGESVRVIPNLPLAAVGIDKGGLMRRALQAIEDAARQVAYTRPGTSSPGGVPTTTTGGAQGDKGKNTGTPSGGTSGGAPTGGAPTGAPSGGAPAPPAPPPPGGGGD
jgi:hypothetical protein